MLTSYRNRFGILRVVVLFGVLYLISQIIIGDILHDMGPLKFIKAQTTFSKSAYVEQVREWQKAGLMEDYRLHFYFDFLHPVWYSLFLSAWMSLVFNLNRLSNRYNGILVLPFMAGAMDLVENCFHVRFITSLETISSWMIVVSALASNLKWALSIICVGLNLYFLIKGIVTLERRTT